MSQLFKPPSDSSFPASQDRTILVPVAAIGLILIQLGAIVAHARRSEIPNIVANVVLIAMAAFVAWGRLGDYPL